MRTRPRLLAALFAVSLLGLSACMVRLGGQHPDRVGSFEYDADVVPMVDRLMREGFGAASSEPFVELMADGAATEEDIVAVLEQLSEVLGGWSGEYTIERHLRPPDRVFVELGPDEVQLMEVYVDTQFNESRAEVRLLVGDVDGELRLIRWDVFPADR